MRTLKTRALVLRRTNYGEADRIVQLLTPENGKLSAIAKGVRKEKSKLASGIELFSISEMTIHQGKAELGIVTSVRLEHFYKDILAEYDRLQFGYDLLKRVGRLAEHMQEPQLFAAVETSLKMLNILVIDLRLIKIWFYLQCAELEGRGLNLSLDSSGQQLREDARYIFDIADMAFIERPNGTFTADHLKILKLLKLKTPDIVAKVSGVDAYLADCESLAHAVAE